MRPWARIGLLASAAAGCAAPPAPPYRPAALEARPAGAGPAAVPTAGPLTLDDCIRLALECNRRVRVADRRVLIARDRIDETFAAVMPKVVAEGRYEARSNRYGMDIGLFSIATDQRDTVTARVSAIVPVYDFGRTRHRLDQESSRADAAELSAERVRQDLVWAVSQAYYRVLEAKQIKAVVDESFNVVASQLKVAQDFYREGLTAKNDMLTVAVQLALRHQERIQAENNVQLAESALARLMGADPSRPPAVADVREGPPWRGAFETVLRLAAERRPDLLALRRQIDAARSDYAATSLDWAPRIDAFGAYNYANDRLLLNADWYSGGFTVQFPLFDGGALLARTAQAAKRVEEAIDLRDDRLDDLVLEVKQAWLAVREAAERIPVARAALELGAENLRISRDQYAQGLLTSADVLVEEERNSRVRSAYSQALYAYRVALAQLANASGGPLPPPEPEPGAPAPGPPRSP
jgi:outer membrane protein TolC